MGMEMKRLSSIVISDSESDDDLSKFDIISMLSTNKRKRSSNSSIDVTPSPSSSKVTSTITTASSPIAPSNPFISLVNQKPTLFEKDRSTGITVLKKATTTAPPPFASRISTSIIEKSNKLVEMNIKEDAIALELLKDDNKIRDKVISSLSATALNNESYVNYIVTNHDMLSLYDFHFLGIPRYIPAIEGSPMEVSMIYNPTTKVSGDIFNSLNYEYVRNITYKPYFRQNNNENGKNDTRRKKQRSADTGYSPKDEIEFFLLGIGVSPVNLQREKITDEDLTIDPLLNLQPISLIVLKLVKFIDYLITTEFNGPQFIKIFRYLGMLMIDIKVFKSEESKMLSQIVNNLIQWTYKSTKEFKINEIIEVWNSITSNYIFLIRIVEVLDGASSKIVNQLRLQFACSLVNIAPFKFQYFKKFQDLRVLINNVLLKEMKQLLYIDYSDSEACDYLQLRIKFEAIVYLLDPSSDVRFIEEFKSLIVDIHRKIPRIFSNANLSLLKSVALMISNII